MFNDNKICCVVKKNYKDCLELKLVPDQFRNYELPKEGIVLMLYKGENFNKDFSNVKFLEYDCIVMFFKSENLIYEPNFQRYVITKAEDIYFKRSCVRKRFTNISEEKESPEECFFTLKEENVIKQFLIKEPPTIKKEIPEEKSHFPTGYEEDEEGSIPF